MNGVLLTNPFYISNIADGEDTSDIMRVIETYVDFVAQMRNDWKNFYFSILFRICLNCNKDKGVHFCPLINNFCCYECKLSYKSPLYHLSFTKVKSKYHLNNVENLRREWFRSRYYQGSLSLVRMGKYLAYREHNGRENFENFLVEKELVKNRRTERKKEITQMRTEKVNKLLEKFNLSMQEISFQYEVDSFIRCGNPGIRKITDLLKG